MYPLIPREPESGKSSTVSCILGLPAVSTLRAGPWLCSGSALEQAVGFVRIQSIKGRSLCHCLYIGGAATPQLWASLAQNAHPQPGTCLLWEFAVLQANNVWQPPTWALELGGSRAGEHSKPICSAHAQLEPRTLTAHHV